MLRMIIRRLLGAARLTTMRMQQPIPSASKLASGLAADPQHYAHIDMLQTGADNVDVSTWPLSQDRMNRQRELALVESE